MKNNPLSLINMAAAISASLSPWSARPSKFWEVDPHQGTSRGSRGRNRQRIGKTRQRKRNRMARESRRINRRVAK